MAADHTSRIRPALKAAALVCVVAAVLGLYVAFGVLETTDDEVVTIQLSAEATEQEQVERIVEAYDAHPDKDIVIEPASRIPSYEERRERFQGRYAKLLAAKQAWEKEQIEDGVFVEGDPPPCAMGNATRELPSHCNGELVLPRNDHASAHERAALSASALAMSLSKELGRVLKGVTPEERKQGFDSPFRGSGEVNQVQLEEDGTLIVDFSATLAEDIADTSGYEIMVLKQQLLATIFRYPQVESVRFELDGNCDAFWNHLRSDCHAAVRIDVPELSAL